MSGNLLVDGVFHEKRVVPSLGIAAVAGYLREHGISVDMFAPNIRHLTEAEAASEILRRNPNFVGFSLLTHYAYSHVKKVLSHLHHARFKPFLCMGGHFASLAYELILQELPEVDCIIVGDGEETCAELLRCIELGRSWQHLLGVALRRPNGAVYFNGSRHAPHLDSYPPMALDFLEELVRRYGTEVRVSLVSSRGCYADCSYCSVRSYSRVTRTKPYRMRSIGRLVAEIKSIQQKYGVRNFALEDDNFLVPGKIGIKRANEFNQAVRACGISMRLFIQTRPECISYESIRALKEIGLCDIFIGTESFDQETLDLYHRNNTVEQTERAFEVFESLGFSANVDAEYRVRIGSMIFHPYVTLDRLHKQIAFFRRYQIPSKKLIKHLFPVEDVELCKRLAAEGLVGKDGKYLFVHQGVQDIYSELNAYYDRFMSLREEIRQLEKIARLQRLDVDLSAARAARVEIEKDFIDLFEAVCKIGDQGREAIHRTCEQHAERLQTALDLPMVRSIIGHHMEQMREFVVHD